MGRFQSIKSRLHVLAALVLSAALAIAPPATASQPPSDAFANPSLTALVDGIDRGEEGPQLVLSEMDISVVQHGALAEVTIEAEIINPTQRQVEATFKMQLPRDAVVVGYALNIGEVMIPGSLIDQPKAQQVYEDEVRGNIDPGLAEISNTNTFSTRIYPIFAEGSRRISLSFVTTVDPVNGLVLPMDSASPIGTLRVHASATGVESAPELRIANGGAVEFVKEGRAWKSSEFVRSELALQGELVLAASRQSSRATTSAHSGGRTFFTITDQVAPAQLLDNPPQHVRIYWDTSRSRADALVEEERALVMSFLDRVKVPSADFVQFSSAAPQVSSFDQTDFERLEARLEKTAYRGATSFAGLDELDLADADLCLIFTDGGVSLDHTALFAPDCPAQIIASGPNIDGARLARIAADANGQILTLDDGNRGSVLTAMLASPLSVARVTDEGGNRLKHRVIFSENGHFTLVGEMGDWPEVTVRFSGVEAGDRRKRYLVSTRNPHDHDAAGALWASQEVTRLAEDPADRDKMKRIAQEFQVASPTMAFLVLEEPGQYVRAEITPPKGFSEEWMENFASAKVAFDQETKRAVDDRFDFVLRQWNVAKEWWAQDFDTKIVPTRQVDVPISEAAENAAEGEVAAMAPPPPPSASPPADGTFASADVAEEAVADESQVIVVTGSRRASNAQDVPVTVTAISTEELGGTQMDVSLSDVLSDQPYLEALDEAEVSQRLAVLAEQEAIYGTVPAFYLDVAEWFRLKGEEELGQQLLLSALDLPSADDETTLIVAFRLERDGDIDAAIALLERLAVVADYRPQPGRTLALSLVARARASEGADRRKDLERAFSLLRDVVLEPADGRYNGIETVALMELNSLIPLIEEAGGDWSIDERLVAKLETDVRIVIEWTAADADLDLWVTEPSGERAGYSNPRTAMGGKISDDMTDGFGPEEYVLRRALKGGYEIRVQGFSGDRINPNGPARVMVRLIEDFAKENHAEQLIDAEIGFDRSNARDNDRVVATIEVR